jgi:hypothetical protein
MPDEKHEPQRPAQQHQPTQQQPAPKSGEQPARPTPQSSDEVMEIRKQAGSIGEVIEPVQRVRQERTN